MKKVCILLLTIGILILIKVNMQDSNNQLQSKKEKIVTQSTKNLIKKSQSKLIHKLTNDFYDAIRNQNVNKFKNMIHNNEIIIFRPYLSGNGTRGADVFERIKKSQIPNDLVFDLVRGEIPISLKTEYLNYIKSFSNIKILKANECFRWNDLYSEDILRTCTKLMGKYNGTSTIAYSLRDGSFCVAAYTGSGLQSSCWTLFEKKRKGYNLKVIAIIK